MRNDIFFPVDSLQSLHRVDKVHTVVPVPGCSQLSVWPKWQVHRIENAFATSERAPETVLIISVSMLKDEQK